MIRVSEPTIYSEHGTNSFFRDLVATQADATLLPPGFAPAAAQDRLNRHRTDIAERAKKVQADFDAYAREHGIESRVAPNLTAGTGGDLAPPGYLIDKFSTAARAGRPLADLVPSMALPGGYATITVPRIVVGTTEGPQQPGEQDSGSDFTTAGAASNVVTISGDGVVSQQNVDLGGPLFDFAVYSDLEAAKNTNLETEMVNGLGQASGQLLGLLNVTGIAAVTNSTASIPALFVALGQAAAQVSDARGLPPTIWLLRGARWFWLAAQVDDQHRPIVPPTAFDLDDANLNPYPRAIANLLGIPAYADGTLPATQGTASNQDVVVATRPEDHLLLESDPVFGVFPGALSGTLQVRLQIREYAAWFPHRLPSATAAISGAGMAIASGF